MSTTEATEQPIYWIVLLERARSHGDRAAATEARRQLARLGVRVTYRRASQHRCDNDWPPPHRVAREQARGRNHEELWDTK
jgi:hypothetical protein